MIGDLLTTAIQQQRRTLTFQAIAFSVVLAGVSVVCFLAGLGPIAALTLILPGVMLYVAWSKWNQYSPEATVAMVADVNDRPKSVELRKVDLRSQGSIGDEWRTIVTLTAPSWKLTIVSPDAELLDQLLRRCTLVQPD